MTDTDGVATVAPSEPGSVGWYPGVMISSTFEDLRDHRAAIIDAVEAQRLYAVAMERDAALPDGTVVEISLNKVRAAAGYVCLVSRRYGQVPECGGNPDGLSLTEMEFREARRLGLPMLVFVMSAEHPLREADVEFDPLKREKLEAFREDVKRATGDPSVQRVYHEFASVDDFKLAAMLSASELRRHLDTARQPSRGAETEPAARQGRPPVGYFRALEGAYRWLDISGIDSDRAFKLQLDKVYVRLRAIYGEDDDRAEQTDSATFGIDAALERYSRLVIVGDPGSGKSTFLRFAGLVLAQCHIDGATARAAEHLRLTEPLPVPIALSCWDLAEYLGKRERATVAAVVEFVAHRATDTGWPLQAADAERVLEEGGCLLLVDGLDEVPTDRGRELVAQLIDELVERYPGNRYVVTSRVRAYTGSTVLGPHFTRCDIQPFSREERAEFLQNWIRQLFGVRGGQVHDGDEARGELAALTEAIEMSSIRDLAVNPLLLTVIAIVHWNRKRLPEQRVDLYDECVDVLLGQRKDAEHQRLVRDTRVFEEEWSEGRFHHRSWRRKRFAEIAYNILCRTDEEIDRRAVLELLVPHYRRSGDQDEDRARRGAERFLENEELRSGLFVRRRATTYRFVHLTFQEYLAAWFLANQDLAVTLDAVASHLREPKWFETLQLLGGELANHSDGYLDRFIAWLLDHVGTGVGEQAPVIALAANVVHDTASVANMSPETQARYEALLRETLEAFAPGSRVPRRTQLDLLEALGGLGASVKDQLVAATRSGLLDVRRRALEMLVPHLSDDDLFAMKHMLADRSQEPVRTYVNAIVARDRTRAGHLLLDLSLYGEKTLDGLRAGPHPRLPPSGIGAWPRLVRRRVRGPLDRRSPAALGVLRYWEDRRAETRVLFERLTSAGSMEAMQGLLSQWTASDASWEALDKLEDRAVDELTRRLLPGGLVLTLEARIDERPESLRLLRRLAVAGSGHAVRSLVTRRGADVQTWELLEALTDDAVARLAGSVVNDDMLMAALARSAEKVPAAGTLLGRLVAAGSSTALRALIGRTTDRAELDELVDGLPDDLIDRLALRQSNPVQRHVVGLRGGPAWTLLRRLAAAGLRDALTLLMERCGGQQETWVLVGGLADRAVERLAALSGGYAADALVATLAARVANHDQAGSLLRRLASAGSAEAMLSLVRHGGQDEATWELFCRGGPVIDGLTRMSPNQGRELSRWLAERWAHRTETWDTLVEMAFRGVPGAQAFVEVGPSTPHAVLSWLARAGRADALTAVLWSADHNTTTVLVRELTDHAVDRLAASGDGLPAGLREKVVREVDVERRAIWWQLIGKLVVAGSPGALRILIQPLGFDGGTSALLAGLPDRAVEHLAVRGSALLYTQIARAGGRLPEVWGLLDRLAACGSAEALAVLLRHRGGYPEAWAAAVHASDGTVERYVDRRHAELCEVISGYRKRPEAWQVLGRFAEAGWSTAVEAFVATWPDRAETWELLERSASTGSAPAMRCLVDYRGSRKQTWELLRRAAEAGSREALRIFVKHRADQPGTWELVARLAEHGTGDVLPLAAWLVWADATQRQDGGTAPFKPDMFGPFAPFDT